MRLHSIWTFRPFVHYSSWVADGKDCSPKAKRASIEKKRIVNNSRYLFCSGAPRKTKEELTGLPSTVIDTLKQMDPKAVAELLLKWTKYGLVHKHRHSWQRWRTPTDGPEKALPFFFGGGITLPLVTFFVAFLRPFVTGFTRFELVANTTHYYRDYRFQHTFAHKHRWELYLMALSPPSFHTTEFAKVVWKLGCSTPSNTHVSIFLVPFIA